MNRIIKFRAWDTETKRMANWDTHSLLDCWMRWLRGEDPKIVVMEFTGLFDKNGIEIYEGDIVKYRFEDYDDYTNYVIEWKEKDCQFRGEEIGGQRHNLSVYGGMEVIGNVFENPELIK